jgi:hypothetical protein
VQRTVLKYLSRNPVGYYSSKGFNNTVLLQEFDLEPLHVRRDILLLLTSFKILHSKWDVEDLLGQLCIWFFAQIPLTFTYNISKSSLMLRCPIYLMANSITKSLNLLIVSI